MRTGIERFSKGSAASEPAIGRRSKWMRAFPATLSRPHCGGQTSNLRARPTRPLRHMPFPQNIPS